MTINGENSYDQMFNKNCLRKVQPETSNLRVMNINNLNLKKFFFNPKSNNFHLQVSPDLSKTISNFNTILSNVNHVSDEKWYFTENGSAGFNYLKNILHTAKTQCLIKNYTLTATTARMTFNRIQTRGGRKSNVTVNICEPYSQILTHIQKFGEISYAKEDWQTIEDQECGKKKPKIHQVRYFNYITKSYIYAANQRTRALRNQKKHQKQQQQQQQHQQQQK